MMSCDAVVVGGGIVGCTAAWSLMNHGLRVAVIDQGKVGRGTSRSSFAWINATSKTNLKIYHDLNALGVRLHFEMSERYGAHHTGFHHCGMLEWASAEDPLRQQALRDRARRIQDWGDDIDWLTRDQLIGHEPNVLFDRTATGLYAHADGWLNIDRFISFVTGQLIANGMPLLEHCHVRRAQADSSGRVSELMTTRGTIACANVVIAAGTNTPAILAQLTDLPGFRLSGLVRNRPALLLQTPVNVALPKINSIIYPPAGGDFHLRSTPTGSYVMGAADTDAQVGESKRHETLADAASRLLHRAGAVIPAANLAPLRPGCTLTVTMHPVPGDGYSIAGPVPGSPGLYMLATHSGVTLAPALGKLLAETIVLAHPSSQLNAFDPSRFF